MARALPLALDGTLLAALYLVAWGVLRSPLYALHPEEIGLAVGVDLVVTAAIVHGVLGSRAGLPRWTVAVPAVVGAGVVSRWVPEPSSGGLVLGLLAASELALGGFAAHRLLALARTSRQVRASGASTLAALESGLAKALESEVLAGAAIMELQVLACGCAGVFRRAPAGSHVFTVHRNHGWLAMAGALVFLSIPEAVGIHLLLQQVAPAWVAWGVTAVTGYGVLWLWGDAQAMRLHPLVVEDGTLRLQVGLRWRADVPLGEIREVLRSPERAGIDLTVLGEPDLTLVLERPVDVRGPLGVVRRGDRISLQVDDPDGLMARISGRVAP